MKFAVVVFPGSNCEADTYHVIREVLAQDVKYVWHATTGKEALDAFDCVVLPGGFAYGDYLRVGAIAAISPVMEAVAEHAARGKLVLGICNGFQILCEAHLLPGALTRNRSLSFICEQVTVRLENTRTPFTCAAQAGERLRLPIKHGEGLYVAPQDELRRMEERGQVLARYVDPDGNPTEAANPNGSMHSIAGVANENFNVFGLMPHPEHAVEKALGGEGGLKIFRSIIQSLA